MDNNQIMQILLSHENLKDLSYDNNTLSYNGKSISLNNIKLSDFFNIAYSQMYLDQNNISAQDFFNIIEVHSKIVEPNIEEIKKEKDVVDLEKYALNFLTNN